MWVQVPVESRRGSDLSWIKLPGADVTDHWQPLDLGTGNQTWLFYKSSTCSWWWAISPGPGFGVSLFLFWDRVSCSSGWPWTQNLTKKDLKFLISHGADGQIMDLLHDVQALYQLTSLALILVSEDRVLLCSPSPSKRAGIPPQPPEYWDYRQAPLYLCNLSV